MDSVLITVRYQNLLTGEERSLSFAVGEQDSLNITSSGISYQFPQFMKRESEQSPAPLLKRDSEIPSPAPKKKAKTDANTAFIDAVQAAKAPNKDKEPVKPGNVKTWPNVESKKENPLEAQVKGDDLLDHFRRAY